MTKLRETLRRLLRQDRNDVFGCPACETAIPPRCSFCPHCYMVLRPEGMAELHHALQGKKVSEEIYILRRLHDASKENVTSTGGDITPPPGSSSPSPGLRTPVRASTEIPRPPVRRLGEDRTSGLMTYAFSAPPPALTRLDDLPALVRWFLNHDRLIPNNVEILEEAHRALYRVEESQTYERHLVWAIADDLRTYDFPDLLHEHLTRLTTVYARTLQALRGLGSRSPADLPEPERQRMWELCLRLGLTATRVRVEGWIYEQHYGDGRGAKKITLKRPSGTPPQRGDVPPQSPAFS